MVSPVSLIKPMDTNLVWATDPTKLRTINDLGFSGTTVVDYWLDIPTPKFIGCYANNEDNRWEGTPPQFKMPSVESPYFLYVDFMKSIFEFLQFHNGTEEQLVSQVEHSGNWYKIVLNLGSIRKEYVFRWAVNPNLRSKHHAPLLYDIFSSVKAIHHWVNNAAINLDLHQSKLEALAFVFYQYFVISYVKIETTTKTYSVEPTKGHRGLFQLYELWQLDTFENSFRCVLLTLNRVNLSLAMVKNIGIDKFKEVKFTSLPFDYRLDDTDVKWRYRQAIQLGK